MNSSRGRVRISSERRGMGKDKDWRKRAQMECKSFAKYDWHSGVYGTSEYNISSVWCTVQTQKKPSWLGQAKTWIEQNRIQSVNVKKRKSLFTDISQIMSKSKKHVLIALKILRTFSIYVISNIHPLDHNQFP